MGDDRGAIAPGDAEEEAVFRDIKGFLERTASPSFPRPVERETALMNSSLDSFTVLQLMMFLSERYRFELQEQDFVEEHFATVATLVKLIVAKRGTS